jgi:hypothetical protein
MAWQWHHVPAALPLQQQLVLQVMCMAACQTKGSRMKWLQYSILLKW